MVDSSPIRSNRIRAVCTSVCNFNYHFTTFCFSTINLTFIHNAVQRISNREAKREEKNVSRHLNQSIRKIDESLLSHFDDMYDHFLIFLFQQNMVKIPFLASVIPGSFHVALITLQKIMNTT